MELSVKIYRRALNVAKELAVLAGKRMTRYLGRAETSKKGEKDLVTEIDLWIENMYRGKLKKAFPDFGFLAEEENAELPIEEYYWAIDPLDGTNNYAHTYPVFCTSISLVRNGRPVLGVVYDPTRGEMFWANKDSAYLNRKKIKPSKTRRLSDSLVCTGFAYRFKYMDDTNISHFIDFLYASQGVRRDGSAALDLCYVACGRLDGFWELNLKPWDTAAGSYILEKAGGKITKFSGKRFDIFYPQVVASNGLIHKEMLSVLAMRDEADTNVCLSCDKEKVR